MSGDDALPHCLFHPRHLTNGLCRTAEFGGSKVTSANKVGILPKPDIEAEVERLPETWNVACHQVFKGREG